MSFDVSKYNHHEVFKLSGELNLYNVAKLRSSIYTYLDDNDTIKSIVMDLSDVSMMDSSGIALLTHLQRKVKEDNIDFYLIRLNNTILTTLKLSSLDKHFKIFRNLEDIV